MSTNTTKQLGIFATIGHVFRKLCSIIVNVSDQADSILDINQDLIDVAKLHSINFKQQTQLELDSQLAEAQSTLNTTT